MADTSPENPPPPVAAPPVRPWPAGYPRPANWPNPLVTAEPRRAGIAGPGQAPPIQPSFYYYAPPGYPQPYPPPQYGYPPPGYAYPTGYPAPARPFPPARLGPRPWGFWATLGLSLACGLIMVAIESTVAAMLLLGQMGGDRQELLNAARDIKFNGFIISVATLAATPVCIGFLLWMTWLRGLHVRKYLGFTGFKWYHLVAGLLVMGAFLGFGDILVRGVGGKVSSEFVTSLYKTAGSLPLLLLALVVGAPLLEETLFRGFLFKGMAESKVGPIWAIVLTALMFAAIHLQYDFSGITQIFVVGLIFGWARHWSGSITLPMILHGVMNLTATIETGLMLAGK